MVPPSTFTRVLTRISIIMEFADNGDLYQKIVSHQKNKKLIAESEI